MESYQRRLADAFCEMLLVYSFPNFWLCFEVAGWKSSMMDCIFSSHFTRPRGTIDPTHRMACRLEINIPILSIPILVQVEFQVGNTEIASYSEIGTLMVLVLLASLLLTCVHGFSLQL